MFNWISLITIALTAISSANSQTLQYKGCQNRDDDYVWTYSVTRQESSNPLTIRLAIPTSAHIQQLTPFSEVDLRKERLGTGNLRRLTFTPTPEQPTTTPETPSHESQTFDFEVRSLRSSTKTGVIEWTIEASPNNITGTILGPTVLYDASILRPVLAAGGSVKFDDIVDFKIENGVMFIQNDSKMRPSMIAGVLLKLFDFQKIGNKDLTEKKTVDFMLSLEFANATSKSLDGFIFGVGLGVNRYLEFYCGMSIRSGYEISPGFRQAAQRLVSDIQGLSDMDEEKGLKSTFKRFQDIANNDKSFDGFPTISPLTNDPIFPGSPLINSTNKAFVFGVALPIDIFNLVRGQ